MLYYIKLYIFVLHTLLYHIENYNHHSVTLGEILNMFRNKICLGRTMFPGDGQADVEDVEQGVDGEHPRRLRRTPVLQRKRQAECL